MNYLKEAEEELKRYNDLNKSLDVIHEDLRIINFDLTTVKASSCDSQPGGNRVNGDDAIANMIFKKQSKERAYTSTKAAIKNIERALDNIEMDGEKKTSDREILKMFYIDKLGETRTAENLFISKATFHRRKYIALKRFATQFFGLDASK